MEGTGWGVRSATADPRQIKTFLAGQALLLRSVLLQHELFHLVNAHLSASGMIDPGHTLPSALAQTCCQHLHSTLPDMATPPPTIAIALQEMAA